MTNETQEILLNVRVNNTDALNNIVAYTNEIEKLREANKALAKDSKENAANAEANAKQIQANNEVIKKYSTTVRQLSKEIQNNISQEKYKEGSLKALRAELSNLTSAYDELSESERNAAQGVELRDKINQVTNQLKAAEESTQRYYRNVGNYENALKNVFGGGLAEKIGGVKAGIMGVRTASDLLSKTPVITIIYALVSILMKLKESMGNNEEQMQRLTKITQPFAAILDGLTRIVEVLADGLAKGLEYLIKWGTALADWVTGTNEASEAVERYVALERERQQLVKDNRDLLVKSAETERTVSELRAKVNDKETYSAKERLKALNEAIKLQGDLARERQDIAIRELKVLEEEGERTKNSAEFNDKLAQAKVKVIQAETAYNNFLREAIGQQSELTKQIREQEEKLTQERIKLREREMDTLAEAEEALLELITDEQTREMEQAKFAGEQKIADLQKRLETEKDLTQKEREAINTMIFVEEEKLQSKLHEIQSKWDTQRAEERAKQIEEELAAKKEEEEKKAEIEAKKKEEEEKRMEEEKQAKKDLFDASVGFLEQIGEENKKFAQAAKVLALGEMLVNNGKAIAAALPSVMGEPFPANIAALATVIATITSTIATAKKTISSAKFAEGGLVVGEGTSTSDSIPAMLSNGESVINARATSLYSPLLSAINRSTGGAAIGARTGELINYNLLVNGIASAVAQVRPVVAVSEIKDVMNRVDVIENLSRY